MEDRYQEFFLGPVINVDVEFLETFSDYTILALIDGIKKRVMLCLFGEELVLRPLQSAPGYYYRVAGCVVPLCETCVDAYEKKCHLDDDEFAEPWEPITDETTCRHCDALLKIETI